MTTRITDRAAVGRTQQQVVALERYLKESSIEAPLLHMVKLRASQINGCAFCMSMHTRDLRNEGEREDRIAVLPAWREASWFTGREQAALALTEAVTTLRDGHVPDHVFDAARAVFNETELADLILGIATINVWNRISITWQIEPEAFIIEPEVAIGQGTSPR